MNKRFPELNTYPETTPKYEIYKLYQSSDLVNMIISFIKTISNIIMTVLEDSIPKTKIVLDFVIVGAGLGGVTAAICLKLAGHNVKLLEQAPELGEIGAGIQIPPPSVKIIKTIGCLDNLLKHSMIPENFKIFRWEDGKQISEQNLVPYTEENYNSMYLHVHRADYHKVLVERAKEVGVDMILNTHINDVDFENNTVTASNGKSYTGDVVIGYDGIKSKLRSAVSGREDLPYDTGDLAYRALIKVEDMKKHAELAPFYETANINFWWGPDKHIVVYLLQGGKTCNVVILSPDTLPKDVAVQGADKEEIAAIFEDWDPRLKTLFSLIQETGKWRLQNSRELPVWTPKKGNFIILGDASHATLPYLASGASQALEDAAVLAGLFSRIEHKSQIRDLLSVCESLRKWRTTQVVQGSTECRNIFHLHDGQEQVTRDKKLAINPPAIGCPNRWADPKFQEFLWGYEAFAEAERGWNEYKTGESPRYSFGGLYEDAKL